MPKASEHLAKVRSNKSMLDHLGDASSTKFHDWYVTVVYYISLHCVEAIFDQEKGWHTLAHKERDEKLLKHFPALDAEFKKAYWRLYQQSREARYMSNRKIQVGNDECEEALKSLAIIENECRNNYFQNYPNT
ncbi:hypothetical protein L0244_10925 [bacterium]|nr:hypothetical protein [bacterium]MCI0690378.1 hypothetical protein [candidate division KSB1 bacterium]